MKTVINSGPSFILFQSMVITVTYCRMDANVGIVYNTHNTHSIKKILTQSVNTPENSIIYLTKKEPDGFLFFCHFLFFEKSDIS